ncbi:MAG TPA: sulfurtransferase complex subunit TusD [Pseudomonadales bacterium]|nr:sulfurtransferase complex subunit TusD [Pseudomonadales bacterium]
MKFAIVVHGAPYASGSSWSALHFARAVIRSGHEIYRVFFYHDAVYTASALMAPPQDELDVHGQWVDLSKQHTVELVVCIASSLRRGMLDETEADRYEKPGHNLDDAFVISGLGQLIDAGLNADRLVTFGA